MITVETYIVKVAKYQMYELKNTLGAGFAKIPKLADINDLSSVIISPDQADQIQFLLAGPYVLTGQYVSGQVFDYTNSPFIIIVNGQKLTNLKDFFIQGTTLYFATEFAVGDIIEIHDVIADETKLVTKNSYNKNAVLKYFSDKQKFKYNQIYEFTVRINNETFSNSFMSQYDPFYSNIKNVRLDTGDLLDGVTDNQIAKIIYMHSKEVYQILSDDNRLGDLQTYKYAQNVVRYKTGIDLCWAIYLSISGKYGVILKQLGDIKIQRDTKLPLINTMVKRLEELLRPNELLLNGNLAMVATFVKGESTAYTVPDRGVF